MYVTVRYWKSSIINLIRKEWSELSALYLKKNVIFGFVYTKSIICKYRPVSTKLGQNIYVRQKWNEFDHGTTGVICS